MSEFNIDLLREVVTWARKSQEAQKTNAVDPFEMQHKQNDWLRSDARDTSVSRYSHEVIVEGFCNTAGCIAGNIAMRLGEPMWFSDGEGHLQATCVRDAQGKVHAISEFARDQLGITGAEAATMFSGGNTIDRIETLAQQMCECRRLTF